MGRRFIYSCDECQKDFGNNMHLNIRNGEVLLSYPIKQEEDSSRSNWKQKKINMSCQEYHFCDVQCLFKFLEKSILKTIEEVKAKILEREIANKAQQDKQECING